MDCLGTEVTFQNAELAMEIVQIHSITMEGFLASLVSKDQPPFVKSVRCGLPMFCVFTISEQHIPGPV